MSAARRARATLRVQRQQLLGHPASAALARLLATLLAAPDPVNGSGAQRS